MRRWVELVNREMELLRVDGNEPTTAIEYQAFVTLLDKSFAAQRAHCGDAVEELWTALTRALRLDVVVKGFARCLNRGR